MDAETLKRLLDLKPLPEEGGYYAESYRSPELLAAGLLPARYAGSRCLATAIFFLLTPDTFSALHRLRSDELYHFYLGDPAEMLLLHPDGSGEVLTLGPDLEAGQRPQLVVPRGVWQGSRVRAGGQFALLGTTVAPGFEFADSEMARRDDLLRDYPAFAERIRRLTR